MAVARPVLTAAAAVCVLAGLLAAPAMAHPLGNFTINHYSRVEVGADAVRVRYVLDLAEIPSVQETRAADTNDDGTVSSAEWDVYAQRKVDDIARQLELTVDGKSIGLRPAEVSLSHPPGQGDIPLVRLEAWFEGSVAGLPSDVQHRGTFRDRGDPARLGWREIVVRAGPGVALTSSNVPVEDTSDELRNYPDNLLQNPMDRREAAWTFAAGADTPLSDAARATRNVGGGRPSDAFAALLTAADLNVGVVAFALAGAAFLGGVHAASPGHGKSIMAAYLVGTHGTVGHALALAASVTIAHTAGVLVLGLATLAASNLIFPEQLYPWLTLVSGGLVLIVGGRFLTQSIRRLTSQSDHLPHQHHHHDHGEHVHPHLAEAGAASPQGLAPTWRALVALGLSGGIVPSGSALVVLLSSIALGRLGFGLVLIMAFGLGMAFVLVATGVLLVHAGRLMLRLFPDGDGASPRRQRLLAAVPLISAGIMILLGLVATVDGLSQLRMVPF